VKWCGRGVADKWPQRRGDSFLCLLSLPRLSKNIKGEAFVEKFEGSCSRDVIVAGCKDQAVPVLGAAGIFY